MVAQTTRTITVAGTLVLGVLLSPLLARTDDTTVLSRGIQADEFGNLSSIVTLVLEIFPFCDVIIWIVVRVAMARKRIVPWLPMSKSHVVAALLTSERLTTSWRRDTTACRCPVAPRSRRVRNIRASPFYQPCV